MEWEVGSCRRIRPGSVRAIFHRKAIPNSASGCRGNWNYTPVEDQRQGTPPW